MIDLAAAKQHLRITHPDFDAKITRDLAAAVAACAECLERPIAADDRPDIEAAVLIVLSTLFESPEGAEQPEQHLPRAAYNLLFPHRTFGAAQPTVPPSTSPIDDPIYQGATWRRTWLLKNADGTPVNLTGALPRWRLMRGASTVLDESAPPRLQITDAPGGVVDLELSDADTAGLSVGAYWFRFALTQAGKTSVHEHAQVQVLP